VAGFAGNERLRRTQRPEKDEEAKRNFVKAATLDRREFFFSFLFHLSSSRAAMRRRLLANTAAPTNTSKRLRPLARQRFMPGPRNRTEMRPSMPAGKRWPCLKAGVFS
jgi:hypothetical protein